MKKLLSVFMAVLMLVSSVAVVGVSAADGYAAKNPITDSFSTYNEYEAENKDKTVYGFDYDFIYDTSESYVDWKKLDIRFEEGGFPIQSTRESISLGIGNMNSYLKRLMNSFFLGGKLYTDEYAVDLINFFGKLVNPNFEPVSKAFESNTTPNEYDFYDLIAVKSGLADVIQTNWIDAGIEFKNFLVAFGVDLSDIVSTDFVKGKPVARVLIMSIINTLLGYGPLEYAIRTLETLSASYSSSLYRATTSLFSMKISQGKPQKQSNGQIKRVEYSVDELKSVQGLLTYAFDGIIDYDFFRFPDAKIATTSDRAEKLLFLMIYFAINYKYNDNAAVVDGFADKIYDFFCEGKRYKTGGYDKKRITEVVQNISKMIDIALKGDISLESIDMLDSLMEENLDKAPDDILTQVKNWLSKIMRKIADYFDYLLKLFTGEIKYGESILD